MTGGELKRGRREGTQPVVGAEEARYVPLSPPDNLVCKHAVYRHHSEIELRHEKKENDLSRRHKYTEKKENEIGAVMCWTLARNS